MNFLASLQLSCLPRGVEQRGQLPQGLEIQKGLELLWWWLGPLELSPECCSAWHPALEGLNNSCGASPARGTVGRKEPAGQAVGECSAQRLGLHTALGAGQ